MFKKSLDNNRALLYILLILVFCNGNVTRNCEILTIIPERYVKFSSSLLDNIAMNFNYIYLFIVKSYFKLLTKFDKGGDYPDNYFTRSVINLQIITNPLIWR